MMLPEVDGVHDMDVIFIWILAEIEMIGLVHHALKHIVRSMGICESLTLRL